MYTINVKMEVKVTKKNIRGSAFKIRRFTKLIQGKTYKEAYDLSTLIKVKGAFFANQVLRSAKANIENNNSYVGELYVKKAVADEGPTMKRYKAKARGSAGPIKRRTTHLTIILSDKL